MERFGNLPRVKELHIRDGAGVQIQAASELLTILTSNIHTPDNSQGLAEPSGKRQ